LTSQHGNSERSATSIETAPVTAGSIIPAATLAMAQAVSTGLLHAPASGRTSAGIPRSSPCDPPRAREPVRGQSGDDHPGGPPDRHELGSTGPTDGQGREPIFDTETGQHLLIPQGARLIGLYDACDLPTTAASLSLTDGMPARTRPEPLASTTR
jgi:hypothetical protein